MNEIPNDFGVHHRCSSSGVVQAWNTRRAGPLKVRVTTSSRPDVPLHRGAVIRAGSLVSFVASIDILLAFQFLDHVIQRLEAGAPEWRYRSIQAASSSSRRGAQLAHPHAPYFFSNDKPGLLQNLDMLLDAVSVMWNAPAKSVIEASAPPSRSRTPRRVASESAANEVSKRVPDTEPCGSVSSA